MYERYRPQKHASLKHLSIHFSPTRDLFFLGVLKELRRWGVEELAKTPQDSRATLLQEKFQQAANEIASKIHPLFNIFRLNEPVPDHLLQAKDFVAPPLLTDSVSRWGFDIYYNGETLGASLFPDTPAARVCPRFRTYGESLVMVAVLDFTDSPKYAMYSMLPLYPCFENLLI